MFIDWQEYFDNTCKGEDAWGNYKTANGRIYVVVDGASNHDGTKTGADVARLVHDRLRQKSPGLHRSSELRELLHSINAESTKVNEGAYAAIAGILHRGTNLYAFGAGDVAIIAKKVNEKLIQVLPLDLTMKEEEAEERAKSEIGQVVNNVSITTLNYTQRIKQYMNHGLSNAIGMGDDFFLHDKYFDAKADTAIVIASDGVTDPFMDPQSEAGHILPDDAEKLHELFSTSKTAEESVAALESMIWDTRVSQKKKIKPDDRTALFLYINAEETVEKELDVKSMTNVQLIEELLKKLQGRKMAALDDDVTIPLSVLDNISAIAEELELKLKKASS
jgi:serine/threonine protein phosphatase PrpC